MRADVRVQGPNRPRQVLCGAGGIQPPLGAVDLLRVGRPLVVLIGELEVAGGVKVEGAYEQVAADLREAGRQGSVVLAGPDRRLLGQGDRPFVEPLGQPHDADAGRLVAGHDRPLDRRRTAPARQQRRVDVEQGPL